jgi:hypothetical protein
MIIIFWQMTPCGSYKKLFLLAVLGASQHLVVATRINTARCAYAASVVGKDLDIFAIEAASPSHIL